MSEDEIITALLKRTLRDVEEPYLIWLAPSLKTFGYVGGYRYGCALHLARQREDFVPGKVGGQLIYQERELVSFLPYQEVLESSRWFSHLSGSVGMSVFFSSSNS